MRAASSRTTYHGHDTAEHDGTEHEVNVLPEADESSTQHGDLLLCGLAATWV